MKVESADQVENIGNKDIRRVREQFREGRLE